MTDPRALRLKVEAIRAAVEGYGREELIEILTWVLRTYVVEGGAPLTGGATVLLDARTELEGLSFAQLVTWLQQHLEVPELSALEVQGERVLVRAGTQTFAVGSAPPPPAAPPLLPPQQQSSSSLPQQPQRPVGQPQPPAQPPAPSSPPQQQSQQPQQEEKQEPTGADSRVRRLEVD